ncbi:MAG: hypothetical protein DRN26_06250 [Thermoplasmata archaeon]|nr:MAG: hypothetical protein DRN26_06250 [Thermoplasmata archaeon]
MMSLCKYKVEEAVKKEILPKEYLLYEDSRRKARHADTLCEGAVRGRDIETFPSINEWISWLSWSTVLLDEKDYLLAAVHALDLAPRLAGTDYGTTRQRDLGQLWTDTIRGFLGEIAFVKWLKSRFGIDAQLDYRKGQLTEFLPSDIKSVDERPPKLNISIKTTKLRGIWLDIPYKQIEHSDIFVLVRVGVTREHFLAFLKKISVIRDKILNRAVELGIITDEEVESIWDTIPEFTRIPAYIVGFFDKREYGDSIKRRDSIFLVDGEMKTKRFIINKFIGYWHPKQDVYKRKVIELLRKHGRRVPDNVKLEFEGIGDFSSTLHFIVSSGVLKRRREDWKALINEI